jgi:hypothetical protein
MAISLEEAQFIKDVSGATGVDPRVLVAWIQAEGAYPSPPGTGGHNYLNMRNYSSDVGVVGQSQGGFDQFSSEKAAAQSTAARIKQPFLWGFLGPVIAAHGSPAAQIQAIGTSGWDAGHYQEGGGSPGSSLLQDYPGGAQAAGSETATKASGGTTLTGIASDIVGGAVGGTVLGPVGAALGVGGGVSGVLTAPEKLYKFVTSYRFLELVGGIVLVAIGLFILARALLSSSPVKIAGQTVGNFRETPQRASQAPTEATAARPIGQQSRRVQRRAGFEGPNNRSSARRRINRERAAASAMSEEIPF